MVSREQEREEMQILQNSIERVINTTLQILESGHFKNERLEELRDINYQDWTELKERVVKLWEAERNRIFLEREERGKEKKE